jgi:hypothetical protein
VSILNGRYGVRNGHYALKVEHINEQHNYHEATENNAAHVMADDLQTAHPVLPEQAQADLSSAAAALNQLSDQIQKNEGAQ